MPALLESAEQEELLARMFEEREIAESTWELIRVRCPKHRRFALDGFRDEPLEQARAVLRGEPVFQRVY